MEAVLERKIKLVKEILDDKTDDEILNKLEKYYYHLTNPPCTYTEDEMELRLTVAEKDFEMGKGISHNEIKRK